MSNWIIPFLAGIFVGQEVKEVPRVRPYIESAVKKIIEVGKDIAHNAESQANKTPPDNTSANNESKRSWWASNKNE